MKPLQEYLREAIKEILEFKKIANAENPEFEGIWQSVENLIDDQFIETATERGIARREKILNIVPFHDDDLKSRRFRVFANWNEKLPYTYRILQNKLDNLCGENGYVIALNAGEYTLGIKIELTQKRMFDEVKKITRQMVPANIIINVELRYNQHITLANFTHAQLSLYTHRALREEVIS